MKLDKFDELVSSFQKLPGIGKKSAIRFAYFVSMEDKLSGINLAHNIENAIRFLNRCLICGGLCEGEICDICCDLSRDLSMLCIVENPKDIMVLENSKSFDGVYFVLENLESDIHRLKNVILKNSTKEVIFALTPGISSDSICIFVEDRLKDLNLTFTKIAQGVPTGVNIENIDMISLTKAIKDRTGI